MSQESRQDMVTVLPNGLRHDERSVWWDIQKHFHPILLTINKPVPFRRIKSVRTFQRPAFSFQRRLNLQLHRSLGSFTFLIRGLAQITVGKEVDRFH